MPNRRDLGLTLNLSEDLIPRSSSNRPGTRISPTHITIHNTDNAHRGADARAHARYVKGADAERRQVSWHYTVDDNRCIKHLPINEKGWHAGRGNSRSIGVEICMNQGIDQAAANRRAATLTAILMHDLGIPIENVVTHNFWTGKNCPRKLLDNQSEGPTWDRFVASAKSIFDSIDRVDVEKASYETLGEGGEADLEDIFPSDDPQFQAWINAHAHLPGEEGGNQLCSLPEVPEKKYEEAIDPLRESILRYVSKKWQNHTVLHYHFLDTPTEWKGSETQKAAVRTAFDTWKSLGIGLEFREVSDRGEAEIRIGFEGNVTDSGESWSYVGRDAIDHVPDPNRRTMNFGWDLTTDYGRDTALHEIGHALGFPHEHQNPNAGILWDEEAVYDTFSRPPNRWDRQKTFNNILRKISTSEIEGTDWDPNSIMHYQFPAGLIRSPEKYRTEPLIPAPGLSDQDISEAKKFYPGSAPTYTELQPFRSVVINIGPGEQLDFVVKPSTSRDYTIQTIGYLDTVLVLFEDIDGEPQFVDGDDDSGWNRNALVKTRLVKGRTYYVRVRLYYADRTGDGAVLLW